MPGSQCWPLGRGDGSSCHLLGIFCCVLGPTHWGLTEVDVHAQGQSGCEGSGRWPEDPCITVEAQAVPCLFC